MHQQSAWLWVALAQLGWGLSAQAQLIPDTTLGLETSVVVPIGPGDTEIEGGARRGVNLFHSFEEFNVEANSLVYFRDPIGNENILTRVTGDNPSNILGRLGVLGDSNLYLLNPNGLIFGPDAELDVEGAFLATTAERFLFEDGSEFSSRNPQPASLLSVNVPVGLQYGGNPGPIQVADSFLDVELGDRLTLAGGDIRLLDSVLEAELGRIYLTSVQSPGRVDIGPNGELIVPNTFSLGTIALNDSLVDASIPNGVAGTAGEIAIIADALILRNDSTIGTGSFGNGAAGDIRILTNTLSLQDGSRLSAEAFNQGDAGDIRILARDRILVNGEDDDGNFSAILVTVDNDAIGNGGTLRINTGSLILSNEGRLLASTAGEGDSGRILITVRNEALLRQGGLIGNSVLDGAEGNANATRIEAGSLSLRSGGQINSFTASNGNAGNLTLWVRDRITVDGESPQGFPSAISLSVEEDGIGEGGRLQIRATSVALTNGGRIFGETLGQGDGGSINLAVRDRLLMDGEASDGDESGILVEVAEGAIGDGGIIRLAAGSLTLSNRGEIIAATEGEGDGGQVLIFVRDEIVMQDALIGNSTLGDAEGNAGRIRVQAESVSLLDGGQINSFTRAEGDSGDITLLVRDRILIDGENQDGFPSAISSSVEDNGDGDGGTIRIHANDLFLTNGGTIFGDTAGRGNGGNVELTVRDRLLIDGESSNGEASGIMTDVDDDAIGNSGIIQIVAGSLTLSNRGEIIASTAGAGNSSQTLIFVRDALVMQDGLIGNSALGDAEGNAGQIRVEAGSASLLDGGQINSFTRAEGNSGDITLLVRDRILIDGENQDGFPSAISSSVEDNGDGNGGTILIHANDLFLTNGGRIFGDTAGRGNGGNIELTVRDRLLIDGIDQEGFPSAIFAFVQAEAIGNGGTIRATVPELTLSNGGLIQVSSFGEGSAGNISLDSSEIYLNNGFLDAETEFLSEELGANIRLDNVDLLVMENGSLISARALENANGGNILIDATNGFLIGLPFENNDIIATAEEGDGGVIALRANRIFGFIDQTDTNLSFDQLRANTTSDISASSEFGTSGIVTLDTLTTDPTQGLAALPDEIVDAADQIGQVCPRGGNAAQPLGRFVVTGRGGIAPSPLGLQEDLGFSVDWMSDDIPTNSPNSTTESHRMPEPDSTSPPLVEANTWHITRDGRAQLVANATPAVPLEHRDDVCSFSSD